MLRFVKHYFCSRYFELQRCPRRYIVFAIVLLKFFPYSILDLFLVVSSDYTIPIYMTCTVVVLHTMYSPTCMVSFHSFFKMKMFLSQSVVLGNDL